MSGALRSTLRVYLWARAQHFLAQSGGPCGFEAAVRLISKDSGISKKDVSTLLAGGFSSPATQTKAARWCGLKRASKHNVPVLVADYSDDFDRGPGGGVAPIPPEKLVPRVDRARARAAARHGRKEVA